MFNSKLFFLVFKIYYNVNFNIEPNLNSELLDNLKPYKTWRFLSVYNWANSLFECYFRGFKKAIGLYNKNKIG